MKKQSIVQVSNHFGIIVRKSALAKKNVLIPKLLKEMETVHPYDENDELLSFGPHFGEAINEFIKRLESLNLVFGEDFIDFADPSLPDWCSVYVGINEK